uniref:Uncharacterized protein n=1 Tax=Arundo donax TaxID=35708 RepID=A0A0A8XS53_ARUDO
MDSSSAGTNGNITHDLSPDS